MDFSTISVTQTESDVEIIIWCKIYYTTRKLIVARKKEQQRKIFASTTYLELCQT